MKEISAQLKTKLSGIRLLILDVDGVLTDGKIYLGPAGEEFKTFFVPDGSALIRGRKSGLKIAWISGRESRAVTMRGKELGIEDIYQGIKDKVEILHQLCCRYDCSPSSTACLGDDLVELPLFGKVGCSFAVVDAHPDLAAAADYITDRKGGEGAVTEVIDLILSNRP